MSDHFWWWYLSVVFQFVSLWLFRFGNTLHNLSITVLQGAISWKPSITRKARNWFSSFIQIYAMWTRVLLFWYATLRETFWLAWPWINIKTSTHAYICIEWQCSCPRSSPDVNTRTCGACEFNRECLWLPASVWWVGGSHCNLINLIIVYLNT